MDFINGNKFAEIAHFKVDFDYNELNTNIYKNNSIIFCKTDRLNQLFDFIKFSKRKYVLITHMSDYPINECRFKKAPSSIVKWYAENAVYEHPNLISIPLGLENHWGNQKGKFTNHEWFLANIDRLKNKVKNSELYCNWNPTTNESRQHITEKIKSNGLQLNIQHNLSFEDYCTNMASHQFVVCPPGNGIDTHRLWESLYLGCFPIVLRHKIYNSYNLPILQINDWGEINSKLLDNHAIKWNKELHHQELYMAHWANLIKEEFKLCVL
jgi:hypothetical protein